MCLGEGLDLLKFLHDAQMALMLAGAGKVPSQSENFRALAFKAPWTLSHFGLR